MIDVTVKITAIIMYCDESILNLELGNGYTIEKCYYDDFPFKSEIENGKNQLCIEYIGSRLHDENGSYFICLKKEDVFSIDGPQIVPGAVITDKTCQCEDEIGAYQEQEVQYLHKIFSLLRLYKNGNIGLYQTFFNYRFKVLGFINNTQNHTSKNSTRNAYDERKYILATEDVERCNQFLRDYKLQIYSMMKPIIDEFVWGLEQTDAPTGFEQYTTALEMALLPVNQPGKKQMLSNRIAVLLGKNDAEVVGIHDKMLDFYRYRSESLHEGEGSNISKQELIEMENYVRQTITAIMQKSKCQLAIDNTKTWIDIKNDLMNELISKVVNKKTAGIL